MPRTMTAVTTRVRVLTLVLELALSISVGACGLKSCVGGATDEAKSCDLDRRMFETAGASSSKVEDASIPGVRLFRYERNRDLLHAFVIGCKPSTGELLEPAGVFELLPHGGGSAEELANLYMWCAHEGGLATNEMVTDVGRFDTLGGAREDFTPPVNRLGVLAFWRAETDTRRSPAKTTLHLQVVDARTGLGSERQPWSGAISWPEGRASAVSALGDPKQRGWAFFLLAYRPRPDIAKELVLSLAEELDPELRYLGMMALRGEVGVEQLDALAHLAGNDAALVRMGVVQTLATIPAADARPLAAAILRRETDSHALRVMQAALDD